VDSNLEGEETFRLRLLGSFVLVRDHQPVVLAAGTQRLLALLAVRGRPVRRRTVADTLWSDAPVERRAGNLRSALWRLNRVDRHLAGTTGDLVGLGPDVEVDLCDVAHQARRLLDGGAAMTTAADLAADVLRDWEDDWVLVERERFRQLRLHALEALAVRMSGQGRHEEAIEAGRAAVSAEPLRESAHRVLIAAYLAGGGRLAAVQQYQECRDLLRRDPGIAPSPALRRLVQARDGGVVLPGDASVTAMTDGLSE
jgi:DNA-binding SARP family transcriptional activator